MLSLRYVSAPSALARGSGCSVIDQEAFVHPRVSKVSDVCKILYGHVIVKHAVRNKGNLLRTVGFYARLLSSIVECATYTSGSRDPSGIRRDNRGVSPGDVSYVTGRCPNTHLALCPWYTIPCLHACKPLRSRHREGPPIDPFRHRRPNHRQNRCFRRRATPPRLRYDPELTPVD